MSVYLVKYDGGQRVVEARTFGSCVITWREEMKSEWWGEDWQPDDEPDSVELISAAPVIKEPVGTIDGEDVIAGLRSLASEPSNHPPSLLTPVAARQILVYIGAKG